ncbi:MAG TPA: ABC transporter ATP-binding protein [Acidimicrobiia bacterium]
MTTPIVHIRGAVKTFHKGNNEVHALRGVDLTIEPGETVVVVGPSGGGKSTLLNLIGGLDRPDSGEVRVAGFDVASSSQRALDAYRRRHIGFVFQFFNLIGSLTARDNVALALAARGIHPWSAARTGAEALLEGLGLGSRADHRPAELSGGEQQRVAIARAVAGEPGVVLADEPTGNIDTEATAGVMAMLDDLNDRLGVTLLVVTHDASLATHADRVLEMIDGRLSERLPR